MSVVMPSYRSINGRRARLGGGPWTRGPSPTSLLESERLTGPRRAIGGECDATQFARALRIRNNRP
jgi:hypothetical protein